MNLKCMKLFLLDQVQDKSKNKKKTWKNMKKDTRIINIDRHFRQIPKLAIEDKQ